MIVWVIENDNSSEPVYFKKAIVVPVAPCERTWIFTSSFNKASKFNTKQEAEERMKNLPMKDDLFVCDHEIVEDVLKYEI